jgi:uncharacterized membrane protein YcgQ (UPF0703/DUF1980 family)
MTHTEKKKYQITYTYYYLYLIEIQKFLLSFTRAKAHLKWIREVNGHIHTFVYYRKFHIYILDEFKIVTQNEKIV